VPYHIIRDAAVRGTVAICRLADRPESVLNDLEEYNRKIRQDLL